MGEDETVSASAATKPLSDRDLRVSDNEREHVVGVLQKAIGRGMLDLDEFTERTDLALAARTRGELNAVLADLPGLVHRDAISQFAPSGYGPPPAFGSQLPGRPLELNAKYSSLVRSGPWIVPQALVVNNRYGSTKLDFSQARVDFPVVYIELNAKWGSVEIIIPEHAAVDVNAITEVKFGSLEDKTRSNGRQGNPRFVVSGRVHGGSLVIKHPRRGLFS
ncbi:MAG: hypothetical protein QOI21_1267 [Actinomycetota bacterium]|jgi:hypothetical protein|nr:hypothetical protein [Actinomycetota bacterium]